MSNLDTLKSLGSVLPAGPQERDAVHVAVVSVEADGPLTPGQRVGLAFGNSGRVGEVTGGWVGVVDPFLTRTVQRGERFWLFLYPGTITSLRHDWAHPAFPDVAAAAPAMSESEAYLRRLADDHGLAYSVLIDVAQSGGSYVAQGYDLHLGLEEEDWRHIEAVTGRKYDDAHRGEVWFGRSC